MKKNIVALAVAAAISAPVAMAGAPTVYGKINFAVQSDASSKTAGMTVDSVASRLGVKGSEDLGNGLKAVYKIEFGLTPDAGGKFTDTDGDKSVGALTNRNQYVGLKGGFGTVLMGRHDTPLKMSQPSDLFNDGISDNSKTMGTGTKGAETRSSNVIAYVSPSFSGVKIIAAGVAGEGVESGLTDVTSIAIAYGSKKKGLYLAAAQDNADGTANDVTRLSAQYKANGLVVNGIHQTEAGNGGTSMVINAGYKMGKMMPKVKWSDNDADAGNKTFTSVGLDYSLGKKTKAYIDLLSRDTAAGGFSSTTVGLIHKF